ncbi:UNKNOWN [Stylonychia lemnae]|uniref:Uncharacterized protein n=1 Tax=Stylonychia lemnae TaxID=5949 RepID=A0A077ZZW5_STYLE|nr:UNKNOWN [Stylonychia lemnae]|eukprot:CDW75167.1 UNKNOWN [Stylonychia lemnae]
MDSQKPRSQSRPVATPSDFLDSSFSKDNGFHKTFFNNRKNKQMFTNFLTRLVKVQKSYQNVKTTPQVIDMNSTPLSYKLQFDKNLLSINSGHVQRGSDVERVEAGSKLILKIPQQTPQPADLKDDMGTFSEISPLS